jgi:hypothetical protein
MRKRWIVLGACAILIGLLWLAPRQLWLIRCREATEFHAQHAGEGPPARIRPDYTDLTIPPNIAPLNFTVLTPGRRYYVRVKGAAAWPRVEVLSRSPSIRLPQRAWRRLLRANTGGAIFLYICTVPAHGTYDIAGPVMLRIAKEPIDPYLVYRVIPPLYNFWGDIEIRERNLESFREKTVLHNRAASNACLNCHSFRSHQPDRMTLGVRSGKVGSSTVMVRDGKAEKVGTKFAYTAWHPSGQVVAYSVNQVHQFFHSAGAEVRDVVDLDSGLAYYDLRTQTAKTAPGINDDNRLETYPTWSPDGKYLYFCSAAFPWQNRSKIPPANYQECRYDLRRISYDVASDRWGEPETVLSSAETGKSILLPRVSPDGRFVLVCMCRYGCFPIYQPSSDLYMLDLKTGECRRLDINSPRSESWHSWSSNGRWIAFSSKRNDGLFTRTYLSYVDASGRAHKPFVVPQEDPAFYDSYLNTNTVPELIVSPVPVSARRLGNVVTSPFRIEVKDPVSFAQKPGANAAASDSPWQSGRGR